MKTNIKRIRESRIGVYVWQLPNGNLLADSDQNILNVPAEYGDIKQMAALQKAAAYYGFPDGKAVFEESHRCTEAEYQAQLEQLIENNSTPNLVIP